MENKWTYHYISKLSHFVSTINSRVNRVTKLAPNKVTKKHEPHLRSLAAEQSSKIVKKPKFNLPDKVRIAKQDLPFKRDINKFHGRNIYNNKNFDVQPSNIQFERREW